MDKLRECPFCGGWAHPVRDVDEECYLVICSSCFARTVGDTLEEAISAWNRRTTPEWDGQEE